MNDDKQEYLMYVRKLDQEDKAKLHARIDKQNEILGMFMMLIFLLCVIATLLIWSDQ